MDEQHVQFQFGVLASAAPASSFNDSTLVPTIPVSWADQMSKAEALVGKGSDLWTKAQLMAQLTSLTYCGFDAVAAWNCSRWAPHAHSKHTVYRRLLADCMAPLLSASIFISCSRCMVVHRERGRGGVGHQPHPAMHARPCWLQHAMLGPLVQVRAASSSFFR